MFNEVLRHRASQTIDPASARGLLSLGGILKRAFRRLCQVFESKGLRGVLDRTWIKLQLLAKRKNTTVRIDGCTFLLDGVPADTTKVDLLTNRYEVDERNAVRRYLPRQLPVIELGGSMGVVACLTNRLLANPTAHVVVEANPLVIPHLTQSREMNDCRFEIVNKAIAYGAGTVTFRPAVNSFGSSMVEKGNDEAITIETVQISTLVHERGFECFTLICDIEGQEYEMIFEETDVLQKAGLIIMETHARLIGEEKVLSMMNRLQNLGFSLIEKSGFVVVLQR